MKTILLQAKNIAVEYKDGSGRILKAVDGVTFSVHAGEAVGLVGESGSGKTSIGKVITGLLSPVRGTITSNEKGKIGVTHRSIQMVFQDSAAALNPRMKVEMLIAEGLIIRGVKDKTERSRLLMETMTAVGLAPGDAERFPHQFSGGQRQRIALARALIVSPTLLVLDEPVSALDVTAGALLLQLLSRLKNERNISYVLISHNLAVVRQICDVVAVMYMGKIVESGPVDDVFANPGHYYTQMLLKAHPLPEIGKKIFMRDEGEQGDPFSPPPGCRFHPRCWAALKKCKRVPPGFTELNVGHRAACHLAGVKKYNDY